MTAVWLQNEELLKYKIGLSSTELRSIWLACRDDMVSHYLSEHTIEPVLYPYDSLILCLYWLRCYFSERALAAEYNVVQSTIHEHIAHTLASLLSCFVPNYIKPHDKPTSRDQLLDGRSYYAVVDASHVSINQPREQAVRSTYYIAKSGTRYGLKFQVACDINGHIWQVSNMVAGSTHDKTLFTQTLVPAALSTRYQVLADLAYLSTPHVITPHKRQPHTELNLLQKRENKHIHSKRAIVENVFHRLKQWAVLGTVYRQNIHDLDMASTIVQVVCALYNLQLSSHPLR